MTAVRVLVAAMPFAGHAAPMTALAAALAGRGHEVVAYCGSRYESRFTAAGAAWLPWREAPDFDERDLGATFPEVGHGRGPRAVTANLEAVFLRTGPAQAADIEAAGRFGVLVSDHLAVGASLAAERSGAPWASVSAVPLSLSSRDLPPFGLGLRPLAGPAGRARDAALRAATHLAVGRRLERTIRDVRVAAGLPAAARTAGMDAFTSPWLALATGAPAIEYPRSDLPETVHFVGRLAPTPAPTPLPDWWPGWCAGDDRRPLVHVTQGTYDVEPADLLRPALAGLADLPVRVAAATGGGTLPDHDVPPNARQAPFLPYDDLLPRTSVMVTNGGWNGVLAALAAGVPLVVAGGALDKPEIARRVAWSGAGVDLRTGRPTPRQVTDAVRHVLADQRYRIRARAVGADLAAHGGAERAAGLVERLALTRRSVRRDG